MKLFKDLWILKHMKRTPDGRYIEKRVKIDKTYFKKLIKEIKIKNKYSWEELAKKVGIGEHTLRIDWLKENTTIPISKFRKIISLNENLSFEEVQKKITFLDPHWGQRIKPKGFGKKITIPKINTKEFAEFYGIMLGDGCIYSNLSGFCITGNKILERRYYEVYIANLIKTLFGRVPGITKSKKENAIRCYLYSKKACLFLLEKGFEKGVKKYIKIPSFFNNKPLISTCLRGLFDTDGSVSSHPNSKIMIHLSVTRQELKESVKKSLKFLDIGFSESKHSIYLYGTKKIDLFFEIIGSSNMKHNYKYKVFKKTGKVPSSKEIENLFN